jgi:RNase P subunit RPR2
MGSYIQALALSIIGVFFLWFGFTLFFRNAFAGVAKTRRRRTPKRKTATGIPGAPRTCPVCSAVLARGERVKSTAYPSMGGKDRLMHISGCTYCLEGDRVRSCPVCGAVLKPGDILVARMYDKPGRSHVHVIGCSQCKKTGKKRGP